MGIYSLDEICHRHCIELIPLVVFVTPAQRMQVSILLSFSSTVIHFVFLFDDGLSPEDCIQCCRENMILAKSSGVTSLVLACNSWTKIQCKPFDIALSLGLRAVEQTVDSICSFSLSSKSLSSLENIVENISTYCDLISSKGISSTVLPGLIESFFLCPLIISKFYTFLYAGYVWNRYSSKLYFESDQANISFMKETVRMVLFPSQFYTRNISDAYHNTDVILNLLSGSRISSEAINSKASARNIAENTLWCIITSTSDVETSG